MNYFEGKPDFTNEIGVKWWYDETFTEQANPEIKGSCWAVELPNGERELVFMNEDQEIIHVTTKPHNMHDWIRIQKLARS